MFYKVKSVEPLQNYILKIVFENGITKYYDVKQLFNKFVVFQSLKNIQNLFNQVQVDTGGYGIYWNQEIDLSCNELWENSYISNGQNY